MKKSELDLRIIDGLFAVLLNEFEALEQINYFCNEIDLDG